MHEQEQGAARPVRGQPIARWFGYVAFVVAVALGLCEVTFRFSERAPWYQRLIEQQRSHGSFAYRRNSLGLRAPEIDAERSSDLPRVLFLGDSFTFGSGVADEEALFPQRVGRALGVDVLNGGIPGSYPAHWHELLERVIEPYAPDVVVVVFFLRDGTRLSSMNHFFGPIRDRIVRRNAASWLYRHSAVYRRVRDALDRRSVANDYTRALHRGYFGSPERTEQWRRQQQHLTAIFDLARAHGALPAFVVFPVLAELDADPYPFARIERLLVRFGKQHGVPTLDLLDAFRGRDGPELWVSAYDQHPNAEAHEIAARALVPFVRRLLQDARAARPDAGR